MRILFDRGPDGSAAEFDVPHQIIEAWEPEDIPAAFAALKSAEG
jgi:para-aminobenzoate synthetase component 1